MTSLSLNYLPKGPVSKHSSQSEVPGDRASIYEFGDQGDMIQPVTHSICLFLVGNLHIKSIIKNKQAQFLQVDKPSFFTRCELLNPAIPLSLCPFKQALGRKTRLLAGDSSVCLLVFPLVLGAWGLTP